MNELHQDKPVAEDAIYDVVVVGAGIHGAGSAQAAAARGWRVLVLEKGEVASGTSSKSSKLIHGGLRYLETFQLRLVYESLRERHLLLRNAPDLVQLRPFHIPVYRSGSRRPLWIRLGLMLYALLGGLGRNTRFRTIPQRQWTHLDGLNTEGLVHVFQYRDAQTDDAALTRAVLASAQSMGAEVRCNTEVVGVVRQRDHFQVAVEAGGEPIRCRALVNAAGPWVNRLAVRIDPQPPKIAVDLVQGVHIVLDFEAPDACYYLESQDDGRAVFALPWQGKVMVGTTEKHCGDAPERCQPSDEEITYLLRVFNHYFPGREATTQDIVATTAGLRVLPQATPDAPVFSKLPRDTLFVLEGKSPVYLAIYGGKLTCYRSTAEKAVRKLVPFMPRRKTRESTRKLMLKPTSTN